MTLDLSDGGKHVRTRDGKAVRIYATDGLFPYRVHGAVQQCEYWEPVTWNEQGEWSIGVIGHRLDLIPYAPTETAEHVITLNRQLRSGCTYAAIQPHKWCNDDEVLASEKVAFTIGKFAE